MVEQLQSRLVSTTSEVKRCLCIADLVATLPSCHDVAVASTRPGRKVFLSKAASAMNSVHEPVAVTMASAAVLAAIMGLLEHWCAGACLLALILQPQTERHLPLLMGAAEAAANIAQA